MKLNYEKFLLVIDFLKKNYIKPIDPAVNPTTTKNANSNRSRGKELTNKFS